MGGARKRQSSSNDFLLSSSLFFCSLISLPAGLIMPYYALGRYLLRVVFVSKTTVILFVLFCPCNGYLFLFSTYGCSSGNCSLSLPFRRQLQPFPSFPIFFMVWLVLLCSCRLPGTLLIALHLPYLDELRLLGLLCFTVCDHIICISLISTDSGCTDVVG